MNAVDVIVEDDAWKSLKRKTHLATEALDVAAARLEMVRSGVVAILLTSDEAVAALNADYRNKTGPTNVLSFPAAETADNHLGDIALAWGVVSQEAGARGIEIADHVRHLLIHGFLHLQGYDHQTDDEAEIMEAIERDALAEIGVADPYAADRQDAGAKTYDR